MDNANKMRPPVFLPLASAKYKKWRQRGGWVSPGGAPQRSNCGVVVEVTDHFEWRTRPRWLKARKPGVTNVVSKTFLLRLATASMGLKFARMVKTPSRPTASAIMASTETSR